MSLRLPLALRGGGVALAREWVADVVEVSCSGMDLDGLLLLADRTEELAGMLLAALRLDLPTVCAPPGGPLCAALTALGLAPAADSPVGVAVALTDSGGPRPRRLVDGFSLANALRAGVASGGGPEVLVHLAAAAREAGVPDFAQMTRVLAPETPEADPKWLAQHSVPGLLSYLGDRLHDVPTVAGRLKENLPPAPPPPGVHARLVFVRARTSGAEAVCRVREGVSEVSGECRVFDSERAAVLAVRAGEVPAGAILVVGGCGPRGGPGLRKLDALGQALRGREAPVLTDGLAPGDAPGAWISLFTPEAAVGGALSRLRDGDTLRMDFSEGRIRTGAGDFRSREPETFSEPEGTGYAARYARTARSALEGAGFG